jgi:Xaa-Pro aminopeptidase
VRDDAGGVARRAGAGGVGAGGAGGEAHPADVGGAAAASARRLARFARALGAAGIDAALISQPQDLFYLTGTAQPCNLLVPAEGEPTLFARRFGALVRAQTDLRVVDGAGFGAVKAELNGARRLGMELDVLPAALVRKAEAAFGREIVDCAGLLLEQRMVKEPEEIDALRAAARLFTAAHEAIVAHLRPGIAEHELSGEVARALRRAGHAGLVAQRRWDAALQPEGAMASGENLATISGGPITVSGIGLSRAVPFGASRRPVQRGDLLNIDVGLNLAGYHADMARTYVVIDASDEVIERAVQVRALQDACLAAIRPGVAAGDVYAAGLAVARAAGVEAIFQGRGPYVGHGIGLELDEPPVLGPGATTPLAEGMVLAIEPKLIDPAFGAVNLEDDIVVTADRWELLSDLPRSVFVVERGHAEALVP